MVTASPDSEKRLKIKKLKSQINVYMCSTLVINMEHYYNPNNNANIIMIIISNFQVPSLKI